MLPVIGTSTPGAIGAQVAHPDKTVVCVSGDASILMNIQELATAAEENVQVKIILLNNTQLGMVRQQQQLFYGARYCASSFKDRTDFVAIARGFGIHAVDLGRADDPAETLAATLRQPGPCLINVPITGNENVYPMVPPGRANREMITAVNADARGADAIWQKTECVGGIPNRSGDLTYRALQRRREKIDNPN